MADLIATLAAARDQIVADLVAQIAGLDIAGHAGKYTVAEAQRYGVCAPVVRVSIDAVPQVEARQYPAFQLQLEAAVVAKTDATASAESRALAIVQSLLFVLQQGNVAVSLAKRPENISADNRYDPRNALAGWNEWAVRWQQTLQPDAQAFADLLTTFQTLYTTYTHVPAAETAQQVSIPQE